VPLVLSDVTVSKDEDGPKRQRILMMLVHGTFTPGMQWVLEGSEFRKELLGALQESTDVEFKNIDWRGFLRFFNNGHHSRLRAGQELAKASLEWVRSEPGIPLFFVAHSHGGNVVMYALRNPELLAATTGVVSLSTPYIAVEGRSLGHFSEAIWAGLGLIALFAVGGTSILLISAEIADRWPSTAQTILSFGPRMKWSHLLAVAPSIVGLGLVFAAMQWTDDFVSAKLKRLRTSSIERFWQPSLEESKCFVAGTAWDEAAGGLAVAQFAADLPMLLSKLPWLVLAAFAWMLYKDPLSMNQSLHSVGAFQFVWNLVIVIAGALYSAVVLTAGLVILFLLLRLVLMVVHSAGFGFISPIVGVVTSITGKRVPPGLYRWRGYVPQATKGMVHSRLYDDRLVIRDIAEWIRGRLSDNKPTASTSGDPVQPQDAAG